MENHKNRLKKNLIYMGIMLILGGITVICDSMEFFENTNQKEFPAIFSVVFRTVSLRGFY